MTGAHARAFLGCQTSSGVRQLAVLSWVPRNGHLLWSFMGPLGLTAPPETPVGQ